MTVCLVVNFIASFNSDSLFRIIFCMLVKGIFTYLSVMIDYAAHFCACNLPKFLTHCLSVFPISNEFQYRGSLFGELSEIASWVSYHLNGLDLLCECFSTI